MNIPLLTQLIVLIEEVFKAHGPSIAEAAGTAAATAAVAGAEQDPKTEAAIAASVALLGAAQNLKAVLNAPPTPPAA